MGIVGLYSFLARNRHKSKSMRPVPLSEYAGKFVAIDTSQWIFAARSQIQMEFRTNGNKLIFQFILKETVSEQHKFGRFLELMMYRVNSLTQHEIKPIFVFDGKAPSFKTNTINKRKEVREMATKKVAELGEINAKKLEEEKALRSKVANAKKDFLQVEKKIVKIEKTMKQVERDEKTKPPSVKPEQPKTTAESQEKKLSEHEKVKMLQQKRELLRQKEQIEQKSHEIAKVVTKIRSDIEKNEKMLEQVHSQAVPLPKPNEIQSIMSLFLLPGDAERICAHLVKMNKAQAVLTADLDTLTFGAAAVLRTLGWQEEDNEVTRFSLNDILHELNIDYPTFVDFCLLCGCDYLSTDKKFAPIVALEEAKKKQNKVSELLNLPEELVSMVRAHFIDPPAASWKIEKGLLETKPNFKILEGFLNTRQLEEEHLESLLNLSAMVTPKGAFKTFRLSGWHTRNDTSMHGAPQIDSAENPVNIGVDLENDTEEGEAAEEGVEDSQVSVPLDSTSTSSTNVNQPSV